MSVMHMKCVRYKIAYWEKTACDIANAKTMATTNQNKHMKSIEKEIFDGNLELSMSFAERYLASPTINSTKGIKDTVNSVETHAPPYE